MKQISMMTNPQSLVYSTDELKTSDDLVLCFLQKNESAFAYLREDVNDSFGQLPQHY